MVSVNAVEILYELTCVGCRLRGVVRCLPGLALSIGCVCCAEGVQRRVADPATQQRMAQRPRLQGKTVIGKPYDLAAHRGKWVLVNVWATWCEPCLKEMPELSALYRRRRDVEVVGLAYEDSTPEEILTFLRSHPVAYPIILVDVSNPLKILRRRVVCQ